jgi:hypothetical protein
MPNHDEHVGTSGCAGGLAACGLALTTPSPTPFQVALESLGGYLAGRATGTFADWGDPPWCGDHRGTYHAVFPTTFALARYATNLLAMQRWCREQAEIAEQQTLLATTPLQAFGCFCQSTFWYLASGAVIGAPVGHFVHLVQDAHTPRGLPLLVRGF